MAATRTTIYEQLIERKVPIPNSTTNDARVVRWLVRILAAEAEDLLASEVTYEQLPAGTIMEHAIGDGLYKEGIFLGLPETEQYSLKINYRKLPADLREWITTQSAVHVSLDGDDYFVSSTWIISTDDGNAGLDLSDFRVEFIGVHRHQANAKHRLMSSGGPVEIDLTLDHIGKACLEAVSIEAFRTYVISTYSGSMTAHRNLYHTVYDNQQAGGANARYAWAERGATSTHRAWLLPWRSVMNALATRAIGTFKQYMRASGAGPHWAGATGGWLSSRPYDNSFDLFKQLHTGSRDVGTQLTNTEPKCVALISDVVSPTMDPTSANWIGGLLGGTDAGRGEDSFFEFANCYELARSLAESAGEKGFLLVSRSGGNYELKFEASLLTADGDLLNSALGELRPGDFTGQIEWIPNERDLRGCEVQVPGAVGADEKTVASYASSSSSKPFVVPAIVHNCPGVGDQHPFTNIGLALPANNDADLVTPNIVGFINPVGYNTRVLYYEDAPAGISTATIAIRVASGCHYNFGKAPSPSSTRMVSLSAAALGSYPLAPYVGAFGPGPPTVYYTQTLWWPLMAMLIEEQRSVNMLKAISRAIVRIFARTANDTTANPHGTALLVGQLIGKYSAGLVGRRFTLYDGSDGFSLAGTGTTLWDVSPSQRNVVITKSQPDHVRGTTKIEAVATIDTAFNEVP